jgi:hypothetical protein
MTKLEIGILSKATFTIAAALAVLAPNALACAEGRGNADAAAYHLLVPSFLSQTEPSLSELPAALPDNGAQLQDRSREHDRSPIVGMWIATFYKDHTNEQFDVAIAQFFADGNEIENDIAVPPRQQNTCYGIWEPSGNRIFKLKHFGWDFTNDILDGTVLETATVRVSSDGNSFDGKYVFDQMDTSGNVIPSLHAEGALKGVRFRFGEH